MDSISGSFQTTFEKGLLSTLFRLLKSWLPKDSSKKTSDGRRFLWRNEGLTLLEITVAMTILTVGLLILLAGFAEGGRARKSAYLFTKAVFLSGDILDQKLREKKLEEGATEGSWEEAPSYKWTLDVKPFESDEKTLEENELLEVTLTTTWPDGSSERSHVLKTFIPGIPE